jgi:hypothetical protein
MRRNPIDPRQVRLMGLSGATDEEMAECLECSAEWLVEAFGAVLVQSRAERRIALRKKQTSVALEGNVSMLNFLGKHELGQNDRQIDSDDDWPEPQLDEKVG